jgi:hypothetical protein
VAPWSGGSSGPKRDEGGNQRPGNHSSGTCWGNDTPNVVLDSFAARLTTSLLGIEIALAPLPLRFGTPCWFVIFHIAR